MVIFFLHIHLNSLAVIGVASTMRISLWKENCTRFTLFYNSSFNMDTYSQYEGFIPVLLVSMKRIIPWELRRDTGGVQTPMHHSPEMSKKSLYLLQGEYIKAMTVCRKRNKCGVLFYIE